jgi:ketosteroid isomerase-like protein
MSIEKMDFKQFMKKREAASLAYVSGDAGPLEKISTHTSPATIFGPNGDCVQGAEEVIAANLSGSKHFKAGSENKFEIKHSAESNELAYWTGVQHSVVQMEGKSKPAPFNLRVTEIFRKEDGEWKLIHRHADQLKDG